MHFSQPSTAGSLGGEQETAMWIGGKVEPETPNWLRLRFRVQVNRKFGTQLGLVGNLQELGMWSSDHKLLLSSRVGEYPMWSSEELLLPVHQRVLSVEYKYVFVDSVRSRQSGACAMEKLPKNRRLEVRFAVTDKLKWTVTDRLDAAIPHVLDIRKQFPVFSCLPDLPLIPASLDILVRYCSNKLHSLSLLDFLSVDYLFRHWADMGVETDSHESLEAALRLCRSLRAATTSEIQPVLRDLLLHCSRTNIPLLHVTQSILDRETIEGHRLTLGCSHAKDLYECLQEYFNISDTSQEAAITRTLVLTSVRRSLSRLSAKSTEPDLLFLYDICLEDLQLAYMRSMFTRPETSLQGLHQLGIILEALELSEVCSSECREYREALESFWHSESSVGVLKPVLLELLRTFVQWKQKYRKCEVMRCDPLGLHDQLEAISDRYVQALFPTLQATLRLIDKDQGQRLYLPLNPGTAVGKIMHLKRLADLQGTYGATIVVLDGEAETGWPASVQALVVLREVEMEVVAECLERKVALAVVDRGTEGNWEGKAQVTVGEGSLEFL